MRIVPSGSSIAAAGAPVASSLARAAATTFLSSGVTFACFMRSSSFIYHIYVVEVGGSSLIGDIYRVAEGKVPYREGLELGIAGVSAALVLMVELGEAGSHFSASGTGSSDDNKSAGGLDVVVLAVALVADYLLEVRGIALDAVVVVHLHAEGLEPALEGDSSGLVVVACENNAADIKTDLGKNVEKADNVHIVGDAQVASDLVFFDVIRIDNDNDLSLVFELEKHLELTVGLEAGENS